MVFNEVISAFVLGLLTPLTAVCVLPLYPGYLAYLSNKFSGNSEGGNKRLFVMFGLLVSLGILIFMLLLGLLFTTVLQVSLTRVIGIVSPIAFGILGVISIMLIFNFNFSKVIPKISGPAVDNPILSALTYGFFFGAIVIPCNPAFIAAFFSRAILISEPVVSLMTFLFFGIGLATPLLVFSFISAAYSLRVVSFLTKYQNRINLIAGLIMLIIAVYYLLCVFGVLGFNALTNGVCVPLDIVFEGWVGGF